MVLYYVHTTFYFRAVSSVDFTDIICMFVCVATWIVFGEGGLGYVASSGCEVPFYLSTSLRATKLWGCQDGSQCAVVS
jgi:hypothetical protein